MTLARFNVVNIVDTMPMVPIPKRFRPHWVYFLPILHFSLCIVSYIDYVIPSLQNVGILFPFILLADLPISIVAYALGWKYPAIANLWIFVVGTLWWYLLSRGLERLLKLAMGRD